MSPTSRSDGQASDGDAASTPASSPVGAAKSSKHRSLLPTRKRDSKATRGKTNLNSGGSQTGTSNPASKPEGGHAALETTPQADNAGVDASRPAQTDESAAPEEEHDASSGNSSTKRSVPVRRDPGESKGTEAVEYSALATKLYTVGYLVLFSILGVLARLGLQTLTFYPNAPVQQGLVWANFTGSFVMGFLNRDTKIFRHEWGGKPLSEAEKEKQSKETDAAPADLAAERKRHGAVKKTIPLFVGLATGFCGSCTSFSSFQRDVFLVLANSAPSPETGGGTLARNGGYSFLGVLASLILTPALSLAALQVGAHLAAGLERFLPSLNFYFLRGFFDPVACFVGFAAWLGAVFMAIFPPDRPHGPAAYRGETWRHETWRGQAIFACVFAPLGTLVRFYVSMWLNPRRASFPLGTFAVNIGGTLVEGLFYDLQHARIPAARYLAGGGRVGCQVLQGLQDGFCGCLTTVSTWVAELKSLRKSHAYVYGVVSLAVGLGLMVIIMGSLRWTHGFAPTACVT